MGQATGTGCGSDFISTYADHADVLEVPRLAHEVVARELLAAILNRNGVRVPHGGLTHPLDSWTVILSTSGVGRSTLVNLAQPILEGAELRGILRSQQWGSAQALYQSFAEYPSGLFIWGELSERLRLLNDRTFGAAKQWLADRYDNRDIPDPITYRETHKSKDTPPIVFKSAPRTNILATSSNEWFFANLATGDSSGGFLPRWTIISVDGPTKDVPTPPPVDYSLQHELIGLLKQVAGIKGDADLTCILPDYGEWYTLTKRRFESQPHRGLAAAFFNRHRVHVLKLALIFEVSRSLSLTVTPLAWLKAKREALQLENTIFKLLPTGMNSTGFKIAEMEDAIRKHPEGMPLTDFTRAFQHVPKRDRQDWLDTLCQGGRVVCFTRESTGGRRPTVLVHEDHSPEYQRQHPADKPPGE
jgi:hypothetical protein